MQSFATGANAVFTISINPSPTNIVTVGYATADNTALAGQDYISESGNLTFTPGQTTQVVTVPVLAATTPEPNSTFFLNLSGVNDNGEQPPVVLATQQATGTIVRQGFVVGGPTALAGNAEVFTVSLTDPIIFRRPSPSARPTTRPTRQTTIKPPAARSRSPPTFPRKRSPCRPSETR